MNKKGNPDITKYQKPKEKMYTEQYLREQMADYYKSVMASLYGEELPMIMTETGFAERLGCDRRTVYNYFNSNFPTLKKEFEGLRADTLAHGAMLGRYQSTMSIFALKNWCNWTDKQEQTIDMNAKVSTIEDYLAQIPDDD